MSNRLAVVVAVSAVSLAAAAGITSCSFGNGEFHCDTNSQCGSNGRCETDQGVCSFPVSSGCDSGFKFGDSSGPQAGMCVPVKVGSGSGSDLPPPPDSGPTPIPPDASYCYGTGIVHVCFAAVPTGSVSVTGSAKTIKTDDPTACAVTLSGADNYCVIAAADITIDVALKATGTKPLVLLATNTITVSFTIDVSSHRNNPEVLGAGHDPKDCPGAGAVAPLGSGGGAGGSFSSQGGAGGSSSGAGGIAGAAVTPTTLRGGCPGQDGQGTQGSGGHGGGAVFLIAGTSITVNADIDANGEGGAGGTQAPSAGADGTGGGGGGGGGMIGFDAPAVTATNALAAVGGGGGEGGAVNGGKDGHDGGDASGTTPGTAGAGNTSSGGDGGAGSSQSATRGGAGNPGTANGGMGGGGGGGGGAGFIIASKGANLGDGASPLPVISQ